MASAPRLPGVSMAAKKQYSAADKTFTVVAWCVIGFVAWKIIPQLLKGKTTVKAATVPNAGGGGGSDAYASWKPTTGSSGSSGYSPMSSTGSKSGSSSEGSSKYLGQQETAAQALQNGDYNSQNQEAIAWLYDEQNGYSEGSVDNADELQDVLDFGTDSTQIDLNNQLLAENGDLDGAISASGADALSLPTETTPMKKFFDQIMSDSDANMLVADTSMADYTDSNNSDSGYSYDSSGDGDDSSGDGDDSSGDDGGDDSGSDDSGGDGGDGSGDDGSGGGEDDSEDDGGEY